MLRVALAGALASLAGCSVLLDFSKGAIPADAMIDAPFTQAACDYKEPDDTFDSAAPITSADSGPAAICPHTPGVDDLDFYRFTVPAGTTKVTVAIQFQNRLGDLDLRLLDANQAVVAQSRGFGDGETIVCPAASPACPTLAAGDYVFEVFGAIAGATNGYTFAVTLQ